MERERETETETETDRETAPGQDWGQSTPFKVTHFLQLGTTSSSF
jgi:hypothetical protein